MALPKKTAPAKKAPAKAAAKPAAVEPAAADLTVDLSAILAAIGQAILDAAGGNPAAPAAKPAAKAKAAPVEEEVEEEEEPEEEPVETPFDGWTLKKMRDMLVADYSYEPAGVKAADKPTLIAALMEETGGVDPTLEAEEEAEEGEEEAEEGYTRDELVAMSLAEIKKVAKEAGHTLAALKGLDVDGIADLLLGADEEEKEEEEEAEEDGLTEEALREMSRAELKPIAKEFGVKVTTKMSDGDIVDAILEAAAAGDEEEEEEE